MHHVLTYEMPDVDLAAMIVWIEMLPEDRGADVETLAREMADPRIQWFHDPARRAGQAIAPSLGGIDKVAWDVYLFFDSHVEWKDNPPTPRQWIHQLDASWADSTRRRFGHQLEPELARLLKSVHGQ